MKNVTTVPIAKEIVRDARWTVTGNSPDPRDDMTQITFEWLNDGSILDYKAQITCTHNTFWEADRDKLGKGVYEPYIIWSYSLFQRDPAKGRNWSSVVNEYRINDPQELVKQLITVIQSRVTKTLEEKEENRQKRESEERGARMVRESVYLLIDKLTECRGTEATPIVPGIE